MFYCVRTFPGCGAAGHDGRLRTPGAKRTRTTVSRSSSREPGREFKSLQRRSVRLLLLVDRGVGNVFLLLLLLLLIVQIVPGQLLLPAFLLPSVQAQPDALD